MALPEILADLVGETALTARQREVLTLYLQGWPAWKTATFLRVSKRTVDAERAFLRKELGARLLVAQGELLQQDGEIQMGVTLQVSKHCAQFRRDKTAIRANGLYMRSPKTTPG